MKKIIVLSLLAYQAFADSNISISNIIIGPQYGEKKTFSITATLSNNSNNTIESWQIGFYMPRNFRTTAKSNKNLSMQICEESSATNCSQLIYQKPAFDKPDLSTAFTTILKPKLNFPIRTGKKYTIKLLRNSSQSSANISSLPQSFFIISKDKLILLPTDLKTYTVLNYNESAVQQKITKYNANKSDNGFKHIINVVPYPQYVNITDPSIYFNLSDKITLHNNAKLSEEQLQFWRDAFSSDFTRSLKIDTDKKSTGIILKHANVINPEGYTITINSQNITVIAKNNAGFFYALQTLRQLWFKQKSIPSLIITDSPRFKYRGVQIDVARHFFTIEELKNFIDIMAANKLNTLHLHLSDDEAFRIELDDYPELTKIGASRGIGKMIGPMSMIQNNLFNVTKDINNTHE
ncbi:MAG: family 20 glycosylhydrolase, partial [Burkholderiales bacterium]|nr:family 20 glycosylhydrolase [Burkholderiales bacterium]